MFDANDAMFCPVERARWNIFVELMVKNEMSRNFAGRLQATTGASGHTGGYGITYSQGSGFQSVDIQYVSEEQTKIDPSVRYGLGVQDVPDMPSDSVEDTTVDDTNVLNETYTIVLPSDEKSSIARQDKPKLANRTLIDLPDDLDMS